MAHLLARREMKRALAVAIQKRDGGPMIRAWGKTRKLKPKQIDDALRTECQARGVALPTESEIDALGDEDTILGRIKAFCEAHPDLIKAVVAVLLALV